MDEQTEWRSEKDKNISGLERVAVAFEALADNGNSLALVNRYQARLQHEYRKNSEIFVSDASYLPSRSEITKQSQSRF